MSEKEQVKYVILQQKQIKKKILCIRLRNL